MLIEEYYTEDEISHMCWHYGQIAENLTHNMKIMLVEKYENEIGKQIDKIMEKKC